ncbi:MAG: 2-hydroxyacid dehydrogenase [Betaproteobacteria bacterium]
MSAPVPRAALLVALRIPDGFRARLAAHYDVLGPFDPPFRDVVDALPRADAERVAVIVAYGTTRMSAAVIAKLPALALVCCVGSGYEGVDLDAARARGIVVTHSVGANAASVADLAMGLLIASVRGIAEGDAFVRRGDWLAGRRPDETRGVTGRRIGVWGLGAIGSKIARRCEAFETEVAYHGRAPRAGVRYAYHDSLVGLALWADVLMVAVRAGPENRHAIDERVLAALGADGHVVNITRGSVIDEDALARALGDGVIAGAGLDVFEREPDVPERLLALRNVVLTPHLGGNTSEAQRAMHEAVAANVDVFATRGTVLTPVEGSARAAAAAE